jgi:hypothetical protein
LEWKRSYGQSEYFSVDAMLAKLELASQKAPGLQ